MSYTSDVCRHVLILEWPGIALPPSKDPSFVSAPDVSLTPTTTSSPFTPSAGASTRRLCPWCHGSMSSVAFIKHSFLF